MISAPSSAQAFARVHNGRKPFKVSSSRQVFKAASSMAVPAVEKWCSELLSSKSAEQVRSSSRRSQTAVCTSSSASASASCDVRRCLDIATASTRLFSPKTCLNTASRFAAVSFWMRDATKLSVSVITVISSDLEAHESNVSSAASRR